MTVVTSIDFVTTQDITSAPFYASKTIKVQGLQKAVLEWSINWNSSNFIAVDFRGIKFNGEKVGAGNSGSAEVTQYVIDYGSNEVMIDYDVFSLAFWNPPRCKATIKLTVWSETTPVEEEPIKLPELPAWVWVIVILVVVLAVIWLIAKIFYKTSPIALTESALKKVLGQ